VEHILCILYIPTTPPGAVEADTVATGEMSDSEHQVVDREEY